MRLTILCALLLVPLALPSKPKGSNLKLAAKIVEKNEPKVPVWLAGQELYKTERVALLLRGASLDEETKCNLLDLNTLKKPNSLLLGEKIDGGKLQGNSFLEDICRKKRASMYIHASSTKKKPRNLAFGRLFNEKILDHFEFKITRSSRQESNNHTSVRKFPSYGSPPCFVFIGQQWQVSPPASPPLPFLLPLLFF